MKGHRVFCWSLFGYKIEIKKTQKLPTKSKFEMNFDLIKKQKLEILNSQLCDVKAAQYKLKKASERLNKLS